MDPRETVIIGGGIAGLACGRRLCDAGAPFTLVTERVGGRIRRSRDGAVNLGAYYVMGDYRHVGRYVRRGRQLSALRSRVHVGSGSYTGWSWRAVRTLRQSRRFGRLLREFREHYEAFKTACETRSQAQAIRADPFLRGLYRAPASELVAECRIADFVEHFAAPGLHGSTFLPLSRLSGFVLLQFTLPMIVPIHEFEFQQAELIRGFEAAIRTGSVTRIDRDGDRHRVELEGGEVLWARNLVVATPIDTSRELLGLGRVKQPVRAHMFQIAGTLRAPWQREPIQLFSQDDPTLAIARQENGSVLFCSRHEKPDFERFFEEHRVVEHHYWNPAFNLEGDALLECEQGENRYLIGDGNVCGLEDSFITGLYAANRILKHGRD
ncbi:MAG: FAD-dependent oxidoreductase [Deltaproteobacteria bacterium]|nr:MAG: FAD-dependent oxidoreductase [Deltaproteobacteria bacterium]